MMEVFASK